MSILLGLSGRQGAGKTHISNWLSGLWMQKADLIEYHYVDDDGDLIVPITLDGKTEDKCIKLKRETLWARENIYPHIKQYSFADTLKKFCIQHFNCTYEQLYGTNEQKSTPTQVTWAGFPDEIRKKFGKKKDEFLTRRELLQAFGTDLVRKIFGEAWVNGCINQIIEDQSEFAIVDDVRFPNEVEGIQKAGGMVVRLNRNIYNSDHESEVALDPENFDWQKFDAVIDNANLTRAEQNQAIYEILHTWGWVTFDMGEWKSNKQLIAESKYITKDSCKIK